MYIYEKKRTYKKNTNLIFAHIHGYLTNYQILKYKFKLSNIRYSTNYLLNDLLYRISKYATFLPLQRISIIGEDEQMHNFMKSFGPTSFQATFVFDISHIVASICNNLKYVVFFTSMRNNSSKHTQQK